MPRPKTAKRKLGFNIYALNLDDNELSSAYLCGQTVLGKCTRFSCVVGLVMNWVDLIAPKVIFI